MRSTRQPELIHGVLPARPVSPPAARRERRRTGAAARDAEQARALRVRLDAARIVIARAADLVAAGWIQNAWYQVRDEADVVHTVTAHNLDVLDCGPVIATCLVGALVQAAGGRYAARDQVTGDSIDLVWHAAFADDARSGVGFCPPPVQRSLRVLDLTRWNDMPGRCISEILELLDAADDRAIAEAVRDRH